VKKENSKKEEE
jgi:hypothetical protein